MECEPLVISLASAYGVYLGVHCPGSLTSMAIQADIFITLLASRQGLV